MSQPQSFLIRFLIPIFLSAFLCKAGAWKQAVSGPGSSEYRHASVTKSVYGEDAEQYWIFGPAGPVPKSAPVIVFNHGWGGTDPGIYGAWIKHIVKRGNIVIYPVYQEPGKWRYPTRQITPNAISAVKKAIKQFQSQGKIKPDLDKFAIVGHSAGGMISANMAALAESSGLPEPKAAMVVQPGRSWTKLERMAIPLEDMKKISPRTLLLAVIGDKDKVVYDKDAKRIFNETPQIPLANKDFIIVVSDSRDSPELSANHFAPVAPDSELSSGEKKGGGKSGFMRGRLCQGKSVGSPDLQGAEKNQRQVDALDYYGFWKLFDALCDAAFYGKNRNYALGNTKEQCFMGKWKDGVPVKKLLVTDSPH